MTAQPRQSKAFDDIDSIADMMEGDELRDIPCNLIDRDPEQPRQTWDTPQAIAEYEATRESLRHEKVRQPVQVRPSPTAPGRFLLIVGENRLRGSIELGYPTIPAVVRQNITVKQVRLDQLIENVRRYGLNPLDLARGIQKLLDEGTTRNEIMDALGCKEQWLSKRLSILRLPADVQEFARQDIVRDIDTLAALSKLDEAERRLHVQALRSGQMDGEAIRTAVSKKRNKKKKQRIVDPNVKKLVTKMQDKFGAKVGLDYNDKTKKGAVTFRFNSFEELQGLLEQWNVSLNDPAED